MNSNATSAEWKAGNVAIMNMWGSRVGPLRETEGSSQVVVDNTAIDAPMTVVRVAKTPAIPPFGGMVGLFRKTFLMKTPKGDI